MSEFVQSALDGFNVCLFSYGQTGSGKTHTMQGSGAGDMRGMIPRAMEQARMQKMFAPTVMKGSIEGLAVWAAVHRFARHRMQEGRPTFLR